MEVNLILIYTFNKESSYYIPLNNLFSLFSPSISISLAADIAVAPLTVSEVFWQSICRRNWQLRTENWERNPFEWRQRVIVRAAPPD